MNLFPVKSVYLCGPITGLSYAAARGGWREQFADWMPPHIHPLSPMRAKEFLYKEQVLKGDPSMYPEHLTATPSGIIARDRNDVKNCDVVVACFLGAERTSIGSCVEIGWADAYRKPLIVVMEAGNVHQHAFITEIGGYVTDKLREAADIATHLLTPGV